MLDLAGLLPHLGGHWSGRNRDGDMFSGNCSTKISAVVLYTDWSPHGGDSWSVGLFFSNERDVYQSINYCTGATRQVQGFRNDARKLAAIVQAVRYGDDFV